MASNQKPKDEKKRGTVNSSRANRKAYKKGSIRNGKTGFSFDENGVQYNPKTGRKRAIERAESRSRAAAARCMAEARQPTFDTEDTRPQGYIEMGTQAALKLVSGM